MRTIVGGARSSALIVGCVTAAALASPAGAVAQQPPLPGPPPGAGLNLPAPPRSIPPAAPGTTPVTIDPRTAGPALLSNVATLTRSSRRVSLRLSCRASGRITLAARAVRRGTLASARYACRGGRASVSPRLSAKDAKRLRRRRVVLAVVTLSSTRLSLTLRATRGAPVKPGGFWSDGQLQCSSDGQAQGYLIAPNWTATPSTSISTRPWLAWHDAATGWHWVGSRGPGASKWYDWTATPQGVAQWLQPTGVPGQSSVHPWSFGPITVAAGSDITVVGVFEAVYWWRGRPTWIWNYVRASAAGVNPSDPSCTYAPGGTS
jgi:hypothetical protein